MHGRNYSTVNNYIPLISVCVNETDGQKQTGEQLPVMWHNVAHLSLGSRVQSNVTLAVFTCDVK